MSIIDNLATQFKGEQIMEIIIDSLDETVIEQFTVGDLDRHMRIIRPATKEDPTVDLCINRLRTVAITQEAIVLDFVTGEILSVNVPNFRYHRIEVL